MPNLTTVNEYNLTSAQSDFTISFDYQKQSYVSVKVEDAALVDVSSNYSGVFTDATTYQFQDSNGDPEQIPSGYRVTFTRDTDISDDLFTFAAGTVIRPDALGDSLKTLRDYTEEKNDQTANVTINIANDAITTATTTATTKASEASASATAAAGSASAASTSASNAATSETNAGTSETNAAASATAAATSASNAATSVTDAAAQVTLAQAEVASAATQASNAATSATNAAASATAAATSATNAGTSETNAAASETAAEAARDIVKDVILGQFADDAAVDTYLSGVSYTKDTGDLYFNTTDSRMKVYTGSAWIDIANTTSSNAAATSATAAQTAQAAAEAALASFNNKWHGEHASDTAVNSAISADSALTLEEGDLYFNSTDNKLKVYNGSTWQNAASVNVINTSTLDTVGDVAAYSGLAQNDFLVRGASAWENQSPATARASMGLGTSTPTNNDFLKYNSISGVWEDVDATAVKTALAISNTDVSGLGTAAVENVDAFATADQGVTADAAVQPNTTPEFTGLGVGTDTPDTIVEVRAADPIVTIRDTETGVASSSSTLRFAESGAGDTLGSYYDIGLLAGELSIREGATERLLLEGNNSVNPGRIAFRAYGNGTHTGNAAKSLAVDSSGNVIEEQDVSSSATPQFSSLTAKRATYPAVNVNEIGQTGQGQLAQSGADVQLRNTGNGALLFFTNNTSRMRIAPNGKVGIGTNSVGKTLDVKGEIRQQFDDTTNLWSDINTGTNAYSPMGPELVVENSGGSGVANSMAGVFFMAGSTSGSQINAARIAAIRESGFNTAIAFATRASSDGMAERMRIASSGEVQTLNSGNMVSVRRADRRTTTGTHTLVGGATLYYANAAATYNTSGLTPGDIVTIYNEGGGTVTVNTGGTVELHKDGEASAVTSAVTIGADTIATVTCVSATKAIISGSDLT